MLSSFILLFSCMPHKKTLAEEKGNEPIVMIFDSIKNNYDTIYFDGGGEAYLVNPVLSIQSTSGSLIPLELKDTINIVPQQNYIIVTHKYSPYSFVKFLLQAGDTARINYVNELAVVNVVNRSVKPCDVNYDYFKHQRYPVIEGMQLSEIITHPSIFYMKQYGKDSRISSVNEIIKKFSPLHLKELQDEAVWLDSLYQTGQFSFETYTFYKERNKYAFLNQMIDSCTDEELLRILQDYNDSLYIHDMAGYYSNYLYTVGGKYVNKKLQEIKNQEWNKYYDFIEDNVYIKGKLSQDLRYTVLTNILTKSPWSDRKLYFDKFVSSVRDTAFIRWLKTSYESQLNPVLATAGDLVLLGFDGKRTTLSEILEHYKGSFVYVDFWASWCAPCLKEMPISRQLRENEDYKDVVFVYLALNDREKEWKLAWEKAQLENYSHNYLVLNSQDAPFVRKYKINSLPRYMIFDKNGNILDEDAPRPSDKKLNFNNL